MQITDRLEASEAAAAAVLGAANATWLARRAALETRPARRGGALALVLLNLALAAESALYLAVLPRPASGPEALAGLFVRRLVLAAVAVIFVIVARSGVPGGRR